MIGHDPAFGAGKSDGAQSLMVRRLEGSDDIRRAARGRNADENIASLSEASNLTREDVLVAIIVTDRRQYKRIRG